MVVYVRQNPAFEGWFLGKQDAAVRRITRAVRLDAMAGCPVDTGDLLLSIGTRYPRLAVGHVVVGTDHWAPVEYGSRPHWILSGGFAKGMKRPYSLRSDEGEYFGPVVWHPGTPAQPFMRPALYRRRVLRGAR